MRILVDENIPQGLDVFSPHGNVQSFSGRKLQSEDLTDVDALILRSITKVNEALLSGTKVRFVGTATIGVDHVDQEYLRKAGIAFASAPGCNSRSVAEYLVAALLHLHVNRGLKLQGQTLGIIGYGNVGKQVAKIATVLGLKILLCDPPLQESGHPGHFLPLSELARQCQILTTHVPLTDSGPHPTFRMLNRKFFASFDSPKALLNTARGEVMDEAGLLWALENKKVTHLVLDVFPGEPRLNPVLAGKADLITPHIAGYSLQGKLNGTAQILSAFCRHFGLSPKTGVQFPMPRNPEIPWPGIKKNPAEALLDIVKPSYDITRDDANLRRFLADPELPVRFDGLRRNYPERHEFSGFHVVGIPSGEFALRESLHGLGFSLDHS